MFRRNGVKIIAVIALQAFCLTQNGLAATTKMQNLRPKERAEQANAAGADELAADLKVALIATAANVADIVRNAGIEPAGSPMPKQQAAGTAEAGAAEAGAAGKDQAGIITWGNVPGFTLFEYRPSADRVIHIRATSRLLGHYLHSSHFNLSKVLFMAFEGLPDNKGARLVQMPDVCNEVIEYLQSRVDPNEMLIAKEKGGKSIMMSFKHDISPADRAIIFHPEPGKLVVTIGDETKEFSASDTPGAEGQAAAEAGAAGRIIYGDIYVYEDMFAGETVSWLRRKVNAGELIYADTLNVLDKQLVALVDEGKLTEAAVDAEQLLRACGMRGKCEIMYSPSQKRAIVRTVKAFYFGDHPASNPYYGRYISELQDYALQQRYTPPMCNPFYRCDDELIKDALRGLNSKEKLANFAAAYGLYRWLDKSYDDPSITIIKNLFMHGDRFIPGLMRILTNPSGESDVNAKKAALCALEGFARVYGFVRKIQRVDPSKFQDIADKIEDVHINLIRAEPLSWEAIENKYEYEINDYGKMALRAFRMSGISEDKARLYKKIHTKGAALVICPLQDEKRFTAIVKNLKPFGVEFEKIERAYNKVDAMIKAQKIRDAGYTIVVVVNDTGEKSGQEIMSFVAGDAKVVVIEKPHQAARIVEEAL